jgi:hypothetical protein
MNTFERARAFVARNARPLDFARWMFLFEGGRAEDVASALAAYQNPDGGFGHALEPDAWNPNSAPMQTWTATEILREIGLFDAAHPVVAGILRYLTSGAHFDGHTWENAPQSNNDFPHAPWWSVGCDSASHTNYNPTACLAGFLLACAPPVSPARALGARVADEAIAAYLYGGLLSDMHTVLCYIRLAEYGARAGLDVSALREKLLLQVSASLTRETEKWETGYVCKPSLFFDSAQSPFRAGNEEIAAFECDFIRRAQCEDGSWPVNWSWGAYPEEWAISKNWWKSDIAIRNMRFLRGMENQ